jgi:hypothetical protein
MFQTPTRGMSGGRNETGENMCTFDSVAGEDGGDYS